MYYMTEKQNDFYTRVAVAAAIAIFLLAVIGLLVWFFLYDMSHDNGLKPGAHMLGTIYR
jgi:hypothetical protein